MTLSNSLELAARKVATPDHINGLTIKKATPFYATRLVSFLKRFNEVSFCDWQNEDLLKGLLGSDSTFCYVAENHSGAIIGAVAGGAMGTRGTINHLAVSPDYRHSRIGTSLTTSILNDFRQHGIRRVFLFIDEANPSAMHFWNKQGFSQTRGEITCEVDL
ncbi:MULTISPECIES: GNAT family N-acetyltransferase [unclassified Pseudomonas]|uniref:GNAT family N-acetyltransferase n=1 Tax=unclassified Pseudomonas TaxID=196821 RepID=UPI000760C2AF|nr:MULTISPECIES: GNAT family N-acetyltransferase [unclassified Pseudomonas]MBK4988842.1 GNAT family N-acetyltransferase [Pseudomonas sp. S36]MBK5004540.1 GNAT family N-acetyltransferase [Pseudomonas sp. S32]